MLVNQASGDHLVPSASRIKAPTLNRQQTAAAVCKIPPLHRRRLVLIGIRLDPEIKRTSLSTMTVLASSIAQSVQRTPRRAPRWHQWRQDFWTGFCWSRAGAVIPDAKLSYLTTVGVCVGLWRVCLRAPLLTQPQVISNQRHWNTVHCSSPSLCHLSPMSIYYSVHLPHPPISPYPWSAAQNQDYNRLSASRLW